MFFCCFLWEGGGGCSYVIWCISGKAYTPLPPQPFIIQNQLLFFRWFECLVLPGEDWWSRATVVDASDLSLLGSFGVTASLDLWVVMTSGPAQKATERFNLICYLCFPIYLYICVSQPGKGIWLAGSLARLTAALEVTSLTHFTWKYEKTSKPF